jgi:acyl-CoA synthetase (AMP-forming)/AMP-acid ligase II/3-oxoacyl-(acyl-carrier-protein) synthase/acyl carrier protein
MTDPDAAPAEHRRGETALEWHLFDQAREAGVGLAELVVRAQLDDDTEGCVAFAVTQPDADLAYLRRWLSARGMQAGRSLLPVFVERIPRTADGAVDEEALAQLPVIDGARLRQLETELRATLGTADVALRIERRVPEETAAASVGTATGEKRPDAPTQSNGAAAVPAVARPLARVAGPPLHPSAELPASLPDALIAAARRRPEHGVIAYDDHGAATTIVYPQLLDDALRIAGGLREAGLRAGEIALLQVPALSDYFRALWGCLLAGVQPVTLAQPPGYDERSPVLDKLHGAWSTGERPWVLASGEAVAGLASLGKLYGEDAAPRIVDLGVCSAVTPLQRAIDGGDVAVLQLSSGTTGRSKLIQIAHRAVVSLAASCAQVTGIDAGDRTVNWLPLDHVGGLIYCHLRDVVLGATNVHAPTEWVIQDPLRWLDLLERHRAQHSWAPNFGYRMTARAIDESHTRHWDLSSVKTLLNGGEQCTLPVVEHFLRATEPFGIRPAHLLLAWGMAETATACTYKCFDEPGAVRAAPSTHATDGRGETTLLSVGAPAPGSEMRIVDDEGADLPVGTVGRLLVRSDRITPGYVRDGAVEATTDADGWFATGDLAFVEDGEIAIAGRSGDVIVVNGTNVLAHEVEQAAGETPGVAAGSVAAFGVPSAASGSDALALLYVTDPPDGGAAEADVRAAVTAATGLAPLLVRAIAAERFARTTSGKVQRALLRTRLLDGAFGPVEGVAAVSEGVRDAAFAPCWAPLRRPSRAPRPLPGPTLVVRSADASAVQLVAALRERGLLECTVEVVAADAWAATDDRYALRVHEAAEWGALGAALRDRPLGSALFLLSHLPDEADAIPRGPARSACAVAYLGLARMLSQCGFSGELLSVSRQLQRIVPADNGSPAPAMTAALALSLRQEAPAIDAWHFDAPGADVEQDAEAIAAATCVRRGEAEVAWRDGRLHVPRLRRTPLTADGAGIEGAGIGGAIVATGALGGVGPELLAPLLRGGDARLLVLGRTPAAELGAAQRDALARLRRLCRNVRYCAVAAQDADGLRRAIAEAEAAWEEPIATGVHLAGAYRSRLLAELDGEQWDAQVSGKADGLANLAELLDGREGASLLVASSLLSRIGAVGSAAYVAANRYLEAQAEALNRRGGIAVRCLSWGLWHDTGMNAGNEVEQHIVRRGVLALSRAEGGALARWAAGQPPAVRYLGLDPLHPRVRGELAEGDAGPLEQLLVELPEGAESVSAPPVVRDRRGREIPCRVAVRSHAGAGGEAVVHPADRAAAAAADGAGAVARRAELTATIAAVLEPLLGGPVPVDRPFAELGLDSIALVRAHVQLEQRLGRTLERTVLFEFPTANALAAQLANGAAGAAAPQAGARAVRRDAGREDVAVVGIALRFPQADTPAAYWDLLRSGRTAVQRFRPQQLRAAGLPEALVTAPDFVPVSAILDDVECFAPETFGMSSREALLTAPQQRLLLEVAHELLVTSGYECAAQEQTVGVFAGTGMNLYPLNTYLLNALRETTDLSDPITAIQVTIGNEPDFAATRVAHRLALTGPAVNVQTACSTALVAVHLARQSLLAGDCDAAIAAAAAVHVPQHNGYLHREDSILSAAGSCRAFDAAADGTVGGNGVAAILLKRAAVARADGDTIHAVIRGSAINNDGGSKVGFTAPSLRGQAAVVARALAVAEAEAGTISYVQAHGTGTPIGDPIEVRALNRAFAASAERRGTCVLGSVKPNIGHLDSCSGLAGLIAAVLALQHREAPPQINYDVPNPELDLDAGPFRIVREPTPLAPSKTPLRASVSALGVGGTNVHLVLEATS